MSKLYFRYSTMNAGKSLEILKIANNYRELGRNVIIFTPALDTRYGVGKVTSRIGFSEESIPIYDDMNIYNTYLEEKKKKGHIYCALVDEAQFLNKDHITDLVNIVDLENTPVICYGLKNDYRNELFEGSKWLLVYADKIEEIKTVCTYCNRKVIMILKLKDGQPVYDGEQIEMGGNDMYKSVCRRHYYIPPME